jgi:hypothetical protein
MAKDIVVRLLADAKGFVKGLGDAEKATEGLSKKQQEAAKLSGGFADKMTELREEFSSKFGPASKNVDDALGKVTGQLSAMPLASQAALGGVTALGAGMAVMVAQGVQKLGALTDSVRQYKDAADLSWESASRINAVFDELGVEAEDGIDVIKTMTEEIALAPDKFERYGVAIARAKDGTVDANATFANLADRFNEISDPTVRAAMGAEIFGDTWLKIAPVLQQGGDEIRRISAAVEDHQIVTEESARQQREMQEALRDLGKEWDGLQMTLAKSALPEIVRTMRDAADTADLVTDAYYALNDVASKIPGTGLAKQYAESINPGLKFRDVLQDIRRWRKEDAEAAKDQEVATDGMTQSVDYSTKAQAEHAEELAVVEARLDDATSATNRYAGQMNAQRREAERLRDAQKQLEQSIDGVYEATIASTNADLAYERQQRTTAQASQVLEQHQATLESAVYSYGAESQEAKVATEEYEAALSTAKGEALNSAAAAVELAKRQAEVEGKTLSAKDANDLMIAKLGELRDATGDPRLKEYIDAVILRMQEAEAAARAAAGQIAEMARQAAIAAGATVQQGTGIITSADTLAGRATGGPIVGGSPYLVGERGPELALAGQSATIIPASMSRQIMAGAQVGGAGAGGGQHFHIYHPIGDPNSFIRWMTEQQRAYEGGLR